MKRIKNYLIIAIYGLILILLLLGKSNIYGARVDWITQHSVIPDYFRQVFYSTGRLIPNFAFNLGAGQNIFNYSYYGLMSPIILLSYLFPFINMKTFVLFASIILYILSGLLLYKYLCNHNKNKEINLLLSLIFLTLGPITFHFHYHIMFVWYFPFLILSLLGMDSYIKDNKSFLLIISVFLVLLINYYYGVTSLLVICVYGIYSLLKVYKNFKEFIIKCLKLIVRIIIPLLLASFILAPTIYAVITANRVDKNNIFLSQLFLFNISEEMYSSFSTGISFIFIVSVIGNLCSKKVSLSNKFLNIILIGITFLPIIMYILNGFLYVRGKVLIPFIILYIISLSSFINKIINQEIKWNILLKIIIPLVVLIIIVNSKNYLVIVFIIDFIITLLSIKLFTKFRNIKILLYPVIIILLVCSFTNNINSKYVSREYFNSLEKDNREVTELMNSINDETFYRSNYEDSKNMNINKIFSPNYYSTSLYSSLYNSSYHDFYNNAMGNNIPTRNSLITGGSDNYLFYRFMGIKYVVRKNDDTIINYPKIASTKNHSLYYIDNTMPIIYSTSNIGSNNQYKKLSFPYNLEYMMNYPVVNSNINKEFISSLKKIDLNIEDSYNFELTKNEKVLYKLNQTITDKYLIIKFNVLNNQTCDQGDISITINGIKNKLTCKDWYYNNLNTSFEYVISNSSNIKELNIELTKGKYNISNINLYTLNDNFSNYQSIKDIKIDKKNSIITGNANMKDKGYIITSLPYDKGFKVFIDNKEINKEKVNLSFLGFKIDNGYHNIKIVYESPLYTFGLVLSVIGLLMTISLILIEDKQNHNKVCK